MKIMTRVQDVPVGPKTRIKDKILMTRREHPLEGEKKKQVSPPLDSECFWQ